MAGGGQTREVEDTLVYLESSVAQRPLITSVFMCISTSTTVPSKFLCGMRHCNNECVEEHGNIRPRISK